MSELNLILDTRENDLVQAMESEYLKAECGHVLFDVESLEVGDILYQRGQTPVCLIERKATMDWVASIHDKRSKNQMMRITQLKKQYPDLLVIFLVEGRHVKKGETFRGGVTQNALYSSIVHRIVRDRFTTFYTADIHDTALIITKIYDQLQEKLDLTPMSSEQEQTEYLKTIQLAPKDNLTPANCFLTQLAQIPGASIDSAKVIAQTYPSMFTLISAYQQLPSLIHKENLLAELPLSNRKLGKVLSKRIFDYLCPQIKPKIKLKSAISD